jgi:hypothetical protein
MCTQARFRDWLSPSGRIKAERAKFVQGNDALSDPAQAMRARNFSENIFFACKMLSPVSFIT